MATKAESTEIAEKRNPLELLLEIGRHEFDVFQTLEGDFVAFPKRGPKVQIEIGGLSGSLISELQMIYYREIGKFPSRKLVEDAASILMSESRKFPKQRLYKRNASIAGVYYVDIGDESGEVIQIKNGEIEILPESPCFFRRNDVTEPLPRPRTGRDLDEVFEVFGVPEMYWPLIKGFLIANLDSEVPAPILLLDGEQGSGKSTLSKVLGALMDPPSTPQTPPESRTSWTDMCSRSRLVILDNVSGIPNWFSDDLCRASTGVVERRRKLYTDASSYSIWIKQIIILNGIGLSISRNDLVDRLIQIKLPTIPGKNKKTERDLMNFWQDIYPEAFASLLNLAARVMANLPNVNLDELPRMADFAKVLKSLDEIEGTNAYQVYCDGLSSMSALTVENDPFLIAITKEIKKPWEGSAAQLQILLSPHTPHVANKNWPLTPRDISAKLSRSAPALRSLGFEIEDLGNRNILNSKKWFIAPETSVTSLTSDIFLFNKKEEKEETEGVEGYQVS